MSYPNPEGCMKLQGSPSGHKVELGHIKMSWLIISGFTTFVRKYDKNNLSFLNNLLFEVIYQAEENKCVKCYKALFVEALYRKERKITSIFKKILESILIIQKEKIAGYKSEIDSEVKS